MVIKDSTINHIIMRRTITYLLAAALVAISCSQEFDDSKIWDKLDDHESRITIVEEQCRQMNANILSLQTIVYALQSNDYITSVAPITESDKIIGYTISFTKSAPITIYHGKNGADGRDGVNGSTPIIGVKQDNDGIYYWTLDGEWLLDNGGNKIKAQGIDGKDGTNGNDGADGNDGIDGTNGQDGANGKDGITPQLKIEDGFWYVSYDNGQSWTRLGNASGEDGKDGIDGTDGDSFFQNVDTSNEDYVIFTLADGTQIKIPTWYAFEELLTMCNQMNGNIESLQTIVAALQNNDYITSCTPLVEDGIQIGYTITFAKSGSITIYHGKDGLDGTNGVVPVIGAKYYTDNVLYWTLDGEWLLDESGEKIRVHGIDGTDAITPQFKIEESYWYISYNNGVTWVKLNKAQGEPGDSLFKSITQDNDNVYMEMSDGHVITIAKTYNLSITFDEDDLNQLLIPETTYSIGYKVTTGTDKVEIEVMSSDNMTARVVPNDNTNLSGNIELTVGQTVDAENKIIVFVSNGNKIIMKSIEFEVAGLKIYDEAVIEIPKNGGYANLEFLSNIECVANIPISVQSWISVVPSTKSTMQYGSIQLYISENTKSTSRSATVRIESLDGKFGVDYIINQAGGQPNNEIWYTTTTGTKLELNKSSGFGAAYLTNSYSNGKGVIKFEESITLVGISSFSGCNTLASIILPESVTSIGANAFNGCTSLSSISMPETITSIGESAFKDCSSLSSFEVPANIGFIGASAFSNCTSLRKFKMPDKVSSVESSLFSGCTSLAEVLLSNNTTNIGASAFSGCISLRDISIPEGITIIGSSAFRECNGLTSVVIPNSVITIEFAAFAECSLLTSISFGENITSIGEKAFWNCDGITELLIPDNVIEIGKATFSDCDGLRKVTIGKNIAKIGGGAFYSNATLSEVYINAETPPVLYSGYCTTISDNGYDSYTYVFHNRYSDSAPSCVVYVPLYSLNKYKTDWKQYHGEYNAKTPYSNIVEGYEFD